MSVLVSHEPTRAAALAARAEEIMAHRLLDEMIRREFQGRIALVSSFGIEAAVLLHMVSTIDAATPVIFLDTGKLFGETLRYRDELVRRLGLADVRSVCPDPDRLAADDPQGMLWRSDPDRCCALRKVEPLERALGGFEAWINGRKRHHGGSRAALPVIEAAGGRIKVNPLASWGPGEIDAYFAAHDLPRHPLEAEGYRSVGCLPCSDRAQPGEGARDGRWRGRNKTECGIHVSVTQAPRDE
jgi:phosphoadenosine phosphosulfate reductase